MTVTRRNTFIMYWDANNLYGLGMDQPLPRSDFNFLTIEILISKLMNFVWIVLVKIILWDIF